MDRQRDPRPLNLPGPWHRPATRSRSTRSGSTATPAAASPNPGGYRTGSRSGSSSASCPRHQRQQRIITPYLTSSAAPRSSTRSPATCPPPSPKASPPACTSSPASRQPPMNARSSTTREHTGSGSTASPTTKSNATHHGPALCSATAASPPGPSTKEPPCSPRSGTGPGPGQAAPRQCRRDARPPLSTPVRRGVAGVVDREVKDVLARSFLADLQPVVVDRLRAEAERGFIPRAQPPADAA